MNKNIAGKLAKRKEEGTYRSLSLLENLIDFASNDYLGFSKIEIPSQLSSLGSTGSRLITGNSSQAINCEKKITDFFESEASLVFNSGYDANLGFFSSIPQKGDLILYDAEIHASIRDGIRLSHAKAHSFAHNSLEDLEKKIQLSGDVKYVVIESLYSMGGDMSPLIPILNICKKYHALLIVDEAHASGIFGENGKGICHAFGIQNEVYARIITFGKSYGSHGAAVLSDAITIDYLINFARSFIYTTALPPENYWRISQLVEYPTLNKQRDELMENITLFRKGLGSKFATPSEINSPIQFLQLGDSIASLKLSEKLKFNGFFAKAVVSPTVAKGQEGIRICIHSFNSKEEITSLLEQLNQEFE